MKKNKEKYPNPLINIIIYSLSLVSLVAALYLKDKQLYRADIVSGIKIPQSVIVKDPQQRTNRQNNTKDYLSDKRTATLWVDLKKNYFVMTIGSKNGVKENDNYVIFDSGRPIGTLTVSKTFENVSEVIIDEKVKQSSLANNYYTVILKEN